MKTEHFRIQGNGMAFCEQNSVLYFSGSPKAYSYPSFIKTAQISKIRGSFPFVSVDGKYLAFYNDNGNLEVYNTNDYTIPIIKRKFKACCHVADCIFTIASILIAETNCVYRIDFDHPEDPILLYDGNTIPDGARAQDGYILRISVYSGIVCVCHRMFSRDSLLSFINIDTGTVIKSINLKYYMDDCFLCSDGTMYLISSNNSLLIYDSYLVNYKNPKSVLSMPNDLLMNVNTTFTYDGLYMATIDSSCKAYLVDIKTKAILMKTDQRVARFSFSNLGNYWLLEGYNNHHMIISGFRDNSAF